MELTGPGRRLMEARKALNISREDVARQLRLKLQIIVAIEEDRVEELPAPIYVAGYLRNYASLLKVPNEPIIDAYEQLHVKAPPIVSDIVKPQRKRVATRLIRWSSIVIVIVLIAGFASWLQTQDFDLFRTAAVPVKEPVTEEVLVTEPVKSEVEGLAEDDTKQLVIESLPAEASQTPVPANDKQESSTEDVAAEPAVTEEVSVTEEAPVAEEVALENLGDKIVMSFNGDCWTEIIDADGKTVIYDLLRDGRTHTFYAKPPFRVFLGNASAVNMFVNDEEFDVTPFIRGTLARFTVKDKNGA